LSGERGYTVEVTPNTPFFPTEANTKRWGTSPTVYWVCSRMERASTEDSFLAYGAQHFEHITSNKSSLQTGYSK